MMEIQNEIYRHYEEIDEDGRLKRTKGILEFERSKQIIIRFLYKENLKILDIGGGTGVYSFWLAELGHEVTLIDPMPNLIEIAKKHSKKNLLKNITIGDVRKIKEKDNSFDLIICFGPFYHLTEFEQRKIALKEMQRVLKTDGFALIAGISKYVSLIQSGLFDGMIEDPEFKKIVEKDLVNGQHRNTVDNSKFFTTSVFMEPNELKSEVQNSEYKNVKCIAVEGPGWIHKDLENIVKNKGKLDELMDLISRIEEVESIMGMSTHFIITAKKASA